MKLRIVAIVSLFTIAAALFGASAVVDLALTGTPTAPTPAAATNTTQLPTTAWFGLNLVGGSPGANKVSEVCPTVSFGGQSATLGPTAIQCDGLQAVAGFYKASMYIETNSAGTGNVDGSFAWHSASGAKSCAMSGCSIAATTQALTAGGNTIGKKTGPLTSSMFHHDGTTDITYTVTYTGTGSYDLYITLQRIQ